MPTVRDLQYFDSNDYPATSTTAEQFSTVSDPGTGVYPILRDRENGIEWQSSGTTKVVIPWSRVIKITNTIV